VGGNHTLSATVLLETLIDFRKLHPAVEVTVETAVSPVIEDYVANSEVDIGLINAPKRLSGCAYETYSKQETFAFVPPGHPLADRTLDLDALIKEPLVARKEAACIKDIKRQGYKPNVTLQFMAPDAVKSAVSKGLGVGLLFRSRIEPDIERGDFHRVDVPELKALIRESFIVYREWEPLSDIAEDFVQALRQRRPGNPGEIGEDQKRHA
jgi:DNA-binding transcriptional LysR family regulator